MHTSRESGLLLSIALLASAILLTAPPAWAGCGCDHPPPDWSLVMPPFASPGKTLTITADGFEFTVGASYKVDFGSGDVYVQAEHAGFLEAPLPASIPPGPVEIKVIGEGIDATYPDKLFTALPAARRIEERAGVFAARDYEAAVGADGTLYLAMDVSEVLAAMQFTFAFHGLLLHFEAEDVVIYNADGVDLTLFTLDVEDPTERQWGSYYGWTVESDAGLPNTWYEPQSAAPEDLLSISSVFTYWRHEFHTYAEAHAPGGSHEVDETGYHPDGTRHVDHDSLVIAIRGVERDSSHPFDLTRAEPLSPGKRQTDVGWVSLVTENPVELPLIVQFVTSSGSTSVEELVEVDD